MATQTEMQPKASPEGTVRDVSPELVRNVMVLAVVLLVVAARFNTDVAAFLRAVSSLLLPH